jgi:hypothetical protein
LLDGLEAVNMITHITKVQKTRKNGQFLIKGKLLTGQLHEGATVTLLQENQPFHYSVLTYWSQTNDIVSFQLRGMNDETIAPNDIFILNSIYSGFRQLLDYQASEYYGKLDLYDELAISFHQKINEYLNYSDIMPYREIFLLFKEDYLCEESFYTLHSNNIIIISLSVNNSCTMEKLINLIAVPLANIYYEFMDIDAESIIWDLESF